MSIPSYFRTVLNTTVTSTFPYPPAIIIKHHWWYFPNADFFIIIRNIVYGLHRRHFEPSPFFRHISSQIEPGYDISRGTTVYLPIPLDDLDPSKFFVFLHYLYYPNLFSGTEEDWRYIRRFGLDWGFQRVAGLAIIRLLEMRQEQLPPVIRRLSQHVGALGILRRNRLRELQIEIESSDDEPEEYFHRG